MEDWLLDRRTLLTYLGIGLVGFATGSRASSGRTADRAQRWAAQIDRISEDLRKQIISQIEWQHAAEQTLGGLHLDKLLHDLQFDTLLEGFVFPDLGVNTIRLRQLESAFPDRSFLAKIFGVKKDRAIIPHGHRNMASAHLVLGGKFALRQFDKVTETPDHMVIEPSVDTIAPIGSVSSISDDKNNVHWFRATSEHAFTLDVIVTNLRGAKWEVHNIDPANGERIGGGRIRVPKLGVAQALEKYGKSSWDLAA
jgi:hypothetical protein